MPTSGHLAPNLAFLEPRTSAALKKPRTAAQLFIIPNHTLAHTLYWTKYTLARSLRYVSGLFLLLEGRDVEVAELPPVPDRLEVALCCVDWRAKQNHKLTSARAEGMCVMHVMGRAPLS
jgi:hypothetical protein